MDHKLLLEEKGERVSNYLRVLLSMVFAGGAYAGYANRSMVYLLVEYYATGIALYSLAPFVSWLFLRLGDYKPSYKYYPAILEYVGFAILLFGATTLDDANLASLAVQNLPVHGVHYLLIIASLLRFSRRFTILNGLASALLFLVVSLTIYFQGAAQAVPKLRLTTILVSAIFILVMGFLASLAVEYVNQLLEQYKQAERQAEEQKKSLESIVINTGMAVGDLNRVVEKISHTIAHNRKLTGRQKDLSQSMVGSIQKSQDASEAIASHSRKQHEISQNTHRNIQRLEQVLENMDFVSKEVGAFGKTVLKQAREAEESMSQTVLEIENIRNASSRVAEIVSVINEIAGQTDLLALNASIEAARAGEQGRGFAVVAEEVSKLAEQAAKQAKEIEALVATMKQATEEGVSRIQESVSVSQQTSQGITEIVEKTEGMGTLFQKQLAYTKELFSSLDEIENLSEKMFEDSQKQGELNQGINQELNEFRDLTQELMQAGISIDDALQKLKETSKHLTQNIK